MRKGIRCECSNFIYTEEADGSIKIRAKLIYEDGGLVKAICRQCKCEYVLPIELKKSIRIFVPTR